MKKNFSVTALEFGIALLALVFNFNQLSLGEKLVLAILMLVNVFMGAKWHSWVKSTSWASASACLVVAGVFSFIGMGLVGLNTFAYWALGTVLLGIVLFAFLVLPIDKNAPNNMLYALASCFAVSLLSWPLGLDFVCPPIWLINICVWLEIAALSYFVLSGLGLLVVSLRSSKN